MMKKNLEATANKGSRRKRCWGKGHKPDWKELKKILAQRGGGGGGIGRALLKLFGPRGSIFGDENDPHVREGGRLAGSIARRGEKEAG